jgi:lipopolysaccharide transport system permease protein
MIPVQYLIFYGHNPMVSVIDKIRWAHLSAKPIEAMMLVSIGVVVVLLIRGLFYFKRREQYFADVVWSSCLIILLSGFGGWGRSM